MSSKQDKPLDKVEYCCITRVEFSRKRKAPHALETRKGPSEQKPVATDLSSERILSEMFSLSKVNKEKLEAATERARASKPLIKELEFGRYEVRSRDGVTRYAVEFKKLDGQIYASCNCKGGIKGACYHVASTLGHFKMRVQERAESKRAVEAASTCDKCHDGPI